MPERRLHQGLVPWQGGWVWPLDRQRRVAEKVKRHRLMLYEVGGLIGMLGLVAAAIFLVLVVVAY